MSSSLRIARTEPGRLKPLIAGISARHERLQALIRRHLPGVTGSLLAEPRAQSVGGAVDWYSDLSGQPIALSALPAAQQAAARKLLQDRLDSLSKLADELPRISPESVDLIPFLRAAARYPGDEHIYLVDGQPVLTFWGHLSPAAARAYGGGAALGAGGGGGRPVLAWMAALLLLGALGAAAWGWVEHQRGQQLERGLEAGLEAAIGAECSPTRPLLELEERLLALDPVETRYPGIWQRLKAERERCAVAARFEKELAAAGGDCPRLARLRRQSASWDLTRPPFAGLSEQLAEELAICEAARGFDERVTAAEGDCAVLAVIDRELGTPADDAPPLLRTRAQLDGELARCALAGRFSRELEDGRGDCPALHRLDGQLAQQDVSRPPLAPVREDLNRELALCVKAEHYAQLLREAQSDCDALGALDRELRAEDVSRRPLSAVRERLDELLDQCQSLEDLDQALDAAGGDCAKLALLGQRLEREGPRNPFFLDVKKRLLQELGFCELADDLDRALSDAGGDCEALAALESRVSATPRDDPRFRPLRLRWEQDLSRCRLAEALERKLADAADDCRRIAEVKAELDAIPAGAPRTDALRTRVKTAWAACKREPPTTVAKAPSQVTRTEKEKAVRQDRKGRKDGKRRRVRCPGERSKEEAPDLVLVFDASASMDRPISENAALGAVSRGLQLGGLAGAAVGILIDQAARRASGPRRIEAAKEAAGRIVQSLPADVDVGLVLVEDCPSARPVGFFAPGQRSSLIRGINGIHPVSGTPLASGILRAANMVDGVTTPAVMVILSDGKESCNQDPCAAAHRVARAKPLLTINVVDITGTGAGNCAARATGGKVYTANNAQQVKAMMQRATQEVRGPAECYRK